jgi:hypothetical protein
VLVLRLRDALDGADTARFSEAEFGAVAPCVPSMGPAHNQSACAERLGAIVRAFAAQGARVEDMAAATGGRHASRDRRGLNDVGLRVWAGNYGQHLTQLGARETSVGRWRVGAAPTSNDVFGHFARRTDSRAGKTNLTFALDRRVFNGSDSFRSWSSTTLHLRVGFFDEGRGSWQLELGYTPMAATPATATATTTTTPPPDGESFLRVQWVAVPKALRARCVNRRRRRRRRRRATAIITELRGGGHCAQGRHAGVGRGAREPPRSARHQPPPPHGPRPVVTAVVTARGCGGTAGAAGRRRRRRRR